MYGIPSGGTLPAQTQPSAECCPWGQARRGRACSVQRLAQVRLHRAGKCEGRKVPATSRFGERAVMVEGMFHLVPVGLLCSSVGLREEPLGGAAVNAAHKAA